jgi:hypothetical protein
VARHRERVWVMGDHDDEYRGVGCTTETANWLNAFHEGDCDSVFVDDPPPCLWGFIGRGGRIEREHARWLGARWADERRLLLESDAARIDAERRADELRSEIRDLRMSAEMSTEAVALRRVLRDLHDIVARLRNVDE